jgi:hypothetical protein
MNATALATRVSGTAARRSALVNWLLAQPRGRWVTGRGRYLRILMTVALLVTGVVAWALALVQPWVGSTGHDAQASATVIDMQRIEAISADLESVCAAGLPPAPEPGRNPFATTAALAAIVRPAVTTTAAESHPTVAEVKNPPQPAATPSARAVLEMVKTLRLEATLVAPGAERWAVINGADYREGETVAGFQIVEIQEGKVRLQQAGVLCLLRME